MIGRHGAARTAYMMYQHPAGSYPPGVYQPAGPATYPSGVAVAPANSPVSMGQSQLVAAVQPLPQSSPASAGAGGQVSSSAASPQQQQQQQQSISPKMQVQLQGFTQAQLQQVQAQAQMAPAVVQMIGGPTAPLFLADTNSSLLSSDYDGPSVAGAYGPGAGAAGGAPANYYAESEADVSTATGTTHTGAGAGAGGAAGARGTRPAHRRRRARRLLPVTRVRDYVYPSTTPLTHIQRTSS